MTIRISRWELLCVIGILDHERTNPQRLIIDLEAEYDYRPGAYLDYASLCDTIEALFFREEFGLLEEALASLFLLLPESFPPIRRLSITLSKPEILPNRTVSLSDERSFN